MKSTVNDVCRQLEVLAPRSLAEEWDNVGLMIGKGEWEVGKIMLALDLTSEVAVQALTCGVDMIVTHHPFFFSPMRSFCADDDKIAIAYEMIKNRKAVYSAHTNLDSACGGVSDVLAEKLGLESLRVLKSEKREMYKFVIFVPTSCREAVLAELRRVGAGRIGDYSDCAYVMEGKGYFRPLAGSSPFIGTNGVLEETEECRIEVLVDKHDLGKTVRAALKAHPYEEPAYDIFVTEKIQSDTGLGRVGVLPGTWALEAFALQVKAKLGIDAVKVADAGRPVKKVALCGGSGAGLIFEAVGAGADTLVTGDVKYHEAQQAIALGLNVIDAGHQATELPILPKLQASLEAWAEREGRGLVILRASEKALFAHY